MGFSMRCDSANLEYNGSSLNGLFAQRGNLLRTEFLSDAGGHFAVHPDAPELVLSRAATEETTVGEFLARNRREFRVSSQSITCCQWVGDLVLSGWDV